MADPTLRNGALAAALLATAGLIAGTVALLRPEADTRHVVVPWGDAGRPAGVRCLAVTVRASPAALALYGLSADGGSAYAHVVVAALPADGGSPALPEGFDSIEDTEREVPCASPPGPLEATIGAGALFDCACGPGCRRADGVTWAAGGKNVLLAGWTAPDAGACVRVPCVELAGSPHNPPECAP